MNIYFLHLIGFSTSKAKISVQFIFIGGSQPTSWHIHIRSHNSFHEFHKGDSVATSVGFIYP